MPRVIPAILVLLALAGCNRDPAGEKQKYIRIGNEYFDNGDYRTASILYRRSIKVDPKFGEAYFHLGKAEHRMGRVRPASQAWRRATELLPGHKEAFASLAAMYLRFFNANPAQREAILREFNTLFERAQPYLGDSYVWKRYRGELELALGQSAEAASLLAEAQSLDASEPPVSLSRAKALATCGRFPEAEELARGVIEAEPGYGPMYDFLYQSYGQLRRMDDAQRVLESKHRNNPDVIRFTIQLATHYRATRQLERMEATLEELVASPEAGARAYDALGNFLLRLGEHDRALAAYEAGAEKSPEEEPAFRKSIVQILVAQGRTDEALSLINTIIEENPGDSEAHSMRAGIRMNKRGSRNTEAAIADLKKSIEDDPGNATLHFQLGRVYANAERFDDARAEYEEALRFRPLYSEARHQLAVTLFELGHYQEALAATGEILQRRPNYVPAHLLRTRSRVKLGDFEEARSEMERLRKQRPAHTGIRRQLALIDMADGKTEQGLATLEELLRENSGDRETYVALVRGYMTSGRLDRAEQLLRKRLAEALNSIALRQLLAEVYLRKKDFSSAARELEAALAIAPRNAGVHVQLGQLYRLTGDLDRARESYRQAHELRPDLPAASFQLCALAGDRQAAVACFTELVESNPDHAQAKVRLARLLSEEDVNLDSALQLAEQARQDLEGDFEAEETLAWIYLRKGVAGSAVGILNNLVARFPDRPTPRYYRALAYYNNGETERAVGEFRAALAMDPALEVKLEGEREYAGLLRAFRSH